jgi:hypothetical protein
MRHSDTTQCTYQEHNAIVLITILSDYIILQITSYILPCIHMYGMEYQKALKSRTIVATLLVTVRLATQQLAQAQQSQDRGLLGQLRRRKPRRTRSRYFIRSPNVDSIAELITCPYCHIM